MALVVVLSLIVLVTVAAMAFFARATSNRAIEASRAGQALSGQVARTAEDFVVAQLISDLGENATTNVTDGVKIYIPTNGLATMPPRRLVDSSLTNNTNFANLAQQSGVGAAHSTTDPARNGRSIAPANWNAPRLLFGGTFATNSAPRWVYILKNGTTTNSISTANSADVTGRFAYNIYNTSGLLDANIAGNPAVTGTNLAAIKVSLAGADLTALPGVTTAALTNLIEFRNPDATAASAYRAYVTNAITDNFRSPVVASTTNNFFHSRQDLIRYATRQNPALTNALPYLTSSSPAANRPTVAVDGDDDGDPDTSPVRRSANATLTRYRDDGSSYTVQVKAGDPLLDHRFSLAKLAWLGPQGPTGGGSAAAIQAGFGLRWNPTEKRWDYVGNSGVTVQSEIDSLEKVAAQNRDPNFLELLNAGIGQGSLDSAANTIRTYETLVANYKAYSGNTGFQIDETPYYQILAIAAAIIDQADPDNFPTAIHFDDKDFYGVEDLPLLAGFYAKAFYKYSGDNLHFGEPPVSLYLIPQLWNPHRSSPYDASLTPPEIKVTFVSGSVVWGISTPMFNPATGQRGSGFPAPPEIGPFNVPINLEDISIAASSGQSFRATPDVIRPGAGIGGSLASGISPFPSTSDYFPAVGLEIGRFDGPSWPAGFTVTGEMSAPYTAPWSIPTGKPKRAYGPRVSIQSFGNVMITLSYRYPGDPSGEYRTYSTLLGKADLPITGLNALQDVSGPALNAADLYSKSRKDVGPIAIRKLDPRTCRFGAFATGLNPPSGQSTPADAWTGGDFFSTANYVYSGTTSFSGPQGYTQEAPALFSLLPAGLYPIYKTWRNTESGAIYQDPDNIARPADGYLAGTTAHPMYPTATGAAGALTPADRVRPIILQRPFRSVAELGYVFRDQPWKTLDFFSDKSADAALLDIFCVNEGTDGGAVGKINPNAAPAPVFEALLRGEPYDDMDARFPSASGSIATATATTVSTATRLAIVASPLLDRSRFPALVSSNALAPVAAPATATTLAKPSREAGVRALADLSDFGNWRVFSDIVVQAGRFLPDKSAPGDFMVEGEERVWTSIALDRQTGRLIGLHREHPSE